MNETFANYVGRRVLGETKTGEYFRGYNIQEFRVLEASISKKFVKVYDILRVTTYWEKSENTRVIEVLND